MSVVWRKEWGAALFVATVLVGVLAVGVTFFVNSGHAAKVPALPQCPTYTPYVATATPKPGATPTAVPTATPYDISTANCPTPPLPTAPPTPKTSPGAPVATASAAVPPVATPPPAPAAASAPPVTP